MNLFMFVLFRLVAASSLLRSFALTLLRESCHLVTVRMIIIYGSCFTAYVLSIWHLEGRERSSCKALRHASGGVPQIHPNSEFIR